MRLPTSVSNHASTTTYCATVSEISLPEEAVSNLQSTERVILTPVPTTSVPMLQTSTVQLDVKFLNGIRNRSSHPLSPRSGRDERFGFKSLQHHRRVVFNDLYLRLWSDRFVFEREKFPPELNKSDPIKRPLLKQNDPQVRRGPHHPAYVARSQSRLVADRCERAVVFDPGRIRSLSPTRASSRVRDRECAHQTLLAGVSRNARS